MYRVTGDLMKNDLVFNLQNNLQTMDRLHNNLATGKKVRVPREDVVAATHAMLYRTRLSQLEQYVKNIDDGSERLTMADDALQSVNDILKRFQELAVQAANGTYTDSDRAKVAVEVDELLRQMVQIGNTKFKGEAIFGGHQTDVDPFATVNGKPVWADREVIQNVDYKGNIGEQKREIEEGQYVSANIIGNKAFWTNNVVVQSRTNIAAWTAAAASQIRVDGKVVDIAAGDNIDTVIAKINNSGAPVYASRWGFNQEFTQVVTTTPHETWLEDIGNGTVLQDIGLSSRVLAPNQAPSNTSRSGLSVFDMAIQLRDDLWKGNVRDIGGRDIALLQSGMDNLLKYNAEVGARIHRFDTVKSKIVQDSTAMTDILAKNENIDFPETIMNLKMLEYIHQSALASGSGIVKQTLVDFMR